MTDRSVLASRRNFKELRRIVFRAISLLDYLDRNDDVEAKYTGYSREADATRILGTILS